LDFPFCSFWLQTRAGWREKLFVDLQYSKGVKNVGSSSYSTTIIKMTKILFKNSNNLKN
jgi:hypothetical protein